MGLMWVSRHCGIEGNEKAYELARKAVLTPYIDPESAQDLPCIMHHEKTTYFTVPRKQKTEEISKMSRNQVRTMERKLKMVVQ